MAQFYEMPAVSPTMELGTLVAWRVDEGQPFIAQTVLAEVGTDKANMDAEIFDEGVLIKKLVSEGDEVPPGFPIAIWGQSVDEDITALLDTFEQKKKGLEPATAPAPAPEPAAQSASPPPVVAPPTRAPAPAPAEVVTIARSWGGQALSLDFMDPPGDLRAANTTRRIAASPLAKRVADELGIDLRRVSGSGPGGRIVRADVEDAATRGTRPGLAAPPPADTAVRNSPMRKTIARRLTQSHQDIPTFFLTAVFAADHLVAFRSQLAVALPETKISYNDVLIACVARALRAVPAANASWGDKEITHRGSVDIGVAVALPDGLITPVVRDADRKSLPDIAAEARELVGRARQGALSPEEYTGATFTISNLGMMGIDEFTAIINPPEAAILAVGALQQQPVVEGGQLGVGWRLKVTMTCDHRVIDGALGATFLQHLRRLVENPLLLMV